MRSKSGDSKGRTTPRLVSGDENIDSRRENETFSKDLNRHMVRRNLGRGILAVAIVGLIVYWVYFHLGRSYSVVSEEWSVDITTTASQNYCQFADGILQYGASGAAFYDAQHKEAWSVAYEMENPAVAVSDDYALIYDQGAKTAAVVRAEDGSYASIQTELPISKGTVSDYGVSALLVEEDLSNTMLFYDRQGSRLEVTVKTLMSESGYPMDMSFSPDGQMMMASFVYVDSGVMQNRIVFYSFDTDRNTSTHVVAAFQQYSDTLFADVAFLTDETAAAFGDGKIVLYSLVNKVDPQELTVIEPEYTITNLAYDQDHIVFATKNGDKVNSSLVCMYNTSGVSVFETETSFEFTDLYLGESGVYLAGESSVQYLNLSGAQMFCGSIGVSILQLSPQKKGAEFLVVTNQKFMKIKLERG